MINAANNPTHHQTRISVGRCTPTATREIDITILPISNTTPRAVTFFLPQSAPRIKAPIAIANETAA